MKYLTVNEIQMAYDLLVVSNPQITNDAQNFAELLVDVYEKTDANGKPHYLCRFYAEGKFCYDEFYPNKSIAFAEQAAKFWTMS